MFTRTRNPKLKNFARALTSNNNNFTPKSTALVRLFRSDLTAWESKQSEQKRNIIKKNHLYIDEIKKILSLLRAWVDNGRSTSKLEEKRKRASKTMPLIKDNSQPRKELLKKLAITRSIPKLNPSTFRNDFKDPFPRTTKLSTERHLTFDIHFEIIIHTLFKKTSTLFITMALDTSQIPAFQKFFTIQMFTFNYHTHTQK